MDKPKTETENNLVIEGAGYKNVKNTYEKYADSGHLVEKKPKEKKNDDDDIFGLISTEVRSTKDLKPETQKSLETLISSLGSDKINTLLNKTDKEKRKAIAMEISSKVAKLNKEQELELIKKIEEWQVPKDISEANAAVVLSWLKNIK